MLACLIGGAFGVWLVATPAVLGYAGPTALNDRIVGPVSSLVPPSLLHGR